MDGLFVRKHAQAVALFNEVSVIRVHSDLSVKDFEVECHEEGKVLEVLVYYPVSNLPLLGGISRLVNFLRAFFFAYRTVCERRGKPNFTHVNILTRNGIAAFLLKKLYGTPYVITEHWSRYLPQNFQYKGRLRRFATNIVCKEAEALMPVSNFLCNAMKSCGIKNTRWKIVPNVVDDFFFDRLDSLAPEVFTFVHVSPFNEKPKNDKGLLRAVAKLRDQGVAFCVTIVGVGIDFDDVVKEAERLKLNDVVTFVGEKTPKEVAQIMHHSSALLMFSNYETECVVVSEALASGLPIVSSEAGAIPDKVPPEAGILVPVGDEDALAKAMLTMMRCYNSFSRNAITNLARSYSFRSVGKLFDDIYNGR